VAGLGPSVSPPFTAMRKVPALVALAGNPNTGKTTLFNGLTGSRAKVGNYPGVTVERRVARFEAAGRAADLVDIPGTYSLAARSAEEQIALAAMVGLRGNPRPDLIVFCVDATQPVRGLYLVLQALELGLRAVVALTMIDEAGRGAPPARALAAALGCPVVEVDGRRRVGLPELRAAIAQRLAETEPPAQVWRWQPSDELREHIAAVYAALPGDWPQSDAMALWALSSVGDGDELVGVPDAVRRAVAQVPEGGRAAGAWIDDEAVLGRYRWLDSEVAPLIGAAPDRTFTERLDRVLLNRVAGFGVFLAIMFVVFQSLFTWADPAISLVETCFAWLGGLARDQLPEGVLTDFLVDGVIAGFGSVVVFLPQILLLFFFIGLMEDSGYMARVAYLMDRIMKTMNLHGRAFVPMLSGFACAVPAILATRTMERQRDRLLTMMVVPLMTCSARLPVYTLIIASLFPAGHLLGVFPVQGLLMIGMYLFSTVTALAAAWVLSRRVRPLRARRLPFVIELPPYRVPRLADVSRMMWMRSSMFLREAGTVILACTIALWALLNFPRQTATDYEPLIAAAPSAEVASALESARDGERLRESWGGKLGHAIEPAIEPLGFDWKIGVGIIGAFAAREVFISTMGVVYSAGEEVDENSATLRRRIRAEVREDGRPVYTPLVGLSLMIFFALACQCMSTLAVVKRETGGYRWPLFLFGYMTALAWLTSFAVYQGGRLLGFD
ncbi:MAG TPA: ferrous iron transport protein B, partial [Kofleriaceae bacterium]|nr:ferrous iron transport protein B [Kofleriaceae bacterium]